MRVFYLFFWGVISLAFIEGYAKNPPRSLLEAHDVTYDQNLGIITAKGNVEVSDGVRTLYADVVSYNEKQGQVVATGNVRLFNEDGSVIMADYVELSDDFKEGFIKNVRMFVNDVRLAAKDARRENTTQHTYNKAVFSPCQFCKLNPNKPPTWQLKSDEVFHDEETHDITYYHTFLEMFGRRVFYFPYFSHPDPHVKRRNGFLMPVYGSQTTFGLIGSFPYYYYFSPSQDIVLRPTFTTKAGVVLGAQYRKHFDTGKFYIEGSITRAKKPEADTNRAPKKTRGHVRSEGEFDIPTPIYGDWESRWGFDVYRSSDKTYLRRYKNVAGLKDSDQNTLTSKLYIENFQQNNYLKAEGVIFQGMRERSNSKTIPLVLPNINYNYFGSPGENGGRIFVNANALSLKRRTGTNMQRLSTQTGWEVPYVSDEGAVMSFVTMLRADGYNMQRFARTPGGTKDSHLRGRVMPKAAVDFSLPLVSYGESLRMIIDPHVGLVVAPNGGDSKGLIPNEDSREFDLDETNILLPNRFNGLDRYDGGQRVNLGVNLESHSDQGRSFGVFVGKSYALRKNTTLGSQSGVNVRWSDYVGRVTAKPGDYLDLSSRFRLNHKSLKLMRIFSSLTLGRPFFQVSGTHVYIDRSSLDNQNDHKNQVSASISSNFKEYWTAIVSSKRNLGSNARGIEKGVTFKYEDDCLVAKFEFNRKYRDKQQDLRSESTFLLTLNFKYLGEVSTNPVKSTTLHNAFG